MNGFPSVRDYIVDLHVLIDCHITFNGVCVDIKICTKTT